MELIGREEGVDRIGKEDEVRLLQRLDGGRKVLFQRLDALPCVQLGKGMLGMQLFKVERGGQRDAVFALGAAVDDQYMHGIASIRCNTNCNFSISCGIGVVKFKSLYCMVRFARVTMAL